MPKKRSSSQLIRFTRAIEIRMLRPSEEEEQQGADQRKADSAQDRALRHGDDVVDGVEGHIARVVKLDALVLRPGQELLDPVMGGLGIEIVQSGAPLRVEFDLLGGIDTGLLHLDHDCGVLAVAARQPSHVHGLVQNPLLDLEQGLLAFRELVEEIVDLEAVWNPLEELHVGQAGDLFHEGDVLLEGLGELLDLAHHLEIPRSVGVGRRIVEDVGDLVGAEVLAELEVSAVGGIALVEVGLEAVVEADSPGGESARSQKQEADREHDPAMVVGPAPDPLEKPAQGLDVPLPFFIAASQ
jgi:hypothetical protein